MLFQKQKTKYVPPQYAKFKEEFNLVDPNQTYKCYRGLFFKSPTKDFKSLKVGNMIKDSGTSWSLIYDVAINFAYDNHGFGGKSKWAEGKSMGIIIEHTFTKDEIMCDLSYMYKQRFKRIEYPEEKEVIVFNNERQCKIVEILNSKKRSRFK